ncbi:hypothetical protein GOBAR_AA09548 [Gossypium barbadense]|uniref:Protein AAR2 homolog n=1 Tax=Gossypium barbadense TaxID=3634 RepID=A0A2P5Y690_GOSBA|nr:hypothetical protein GOBAR_AA09548 [Gossypium barbadense]
MMDADKALELVKSGATLLLLDVPQYTLIGIDTQLFHQGWQRVFTNYWLLYRCWILSGVKEERYRQAVRSFEFDKHLGPYDLSLYADWKRLSNYITKSTIERLPIGGEITVTYEHGMLKNTCKSAMERVLDEQLRNSKFSSPAEEHPKRGCYYTPIPRIIKRKGIESEQLTSLNLDKASTELLETLLVKDYGGSEESLLGELQFAFIAFLMGQSLEAFMQWKSLVSLLLGCTEADKLIDPPSAIVSGDIPNKKETLYWVFLPFQTRSRLFTKFIKVIYYQLKYGLQKDRSVGEAGTSALLDDSWFSSDSFLHRLCKDFFSLVQDASVVDGDLLSWTRKLKELLENSLGWEFRQKSAVDGIYFEENDEYAPVVEMLDEPSGSEPTS